MSKEMFYVKNGKKQDAGLHEDILDNKSAAKTSRKYSHMILQKHGISSKTANKVLRNEK